MRLLLSPWNPDPNPTFYRKSLPSPSVFHFLCKLWGLLAPGIPATFPQPAASWPRGCPTQLRGQLGRPRLLRPGRQAPTVSAHVLASYRWVPAAPARLAPRPIGTPREHGRRLHRRAAALGGSRAHGLPTARPRTGLERASAGAPPPRWGLPSLPPSLLQVSRRLSLSPQPVPASSSQTAVSGPDGDSSLLTHGPNTAAPQPSRAGPA